MGISEQRQKQAMIDQLINWMERKNYHYINGQLCGPNVQGSICVPDFACCHEGVSTDIETKKEFFEAFITGNDEKIHQMCMMFLQGVLPEVKIIEADNIDGLIQ